jgi:hypothetical protein
MPLWGMNCRPRPVVGAAERPPKAAAPHTTDAAETDRLCCKSLFASLDANFSSCRSDFRINMRGTLSPDDKLTGDFGNELEAISIGDCGSFHLLAGNLSPGISGLLQHNRPRAGITRPFRLLVGMQPVCHCHKPRFLIAVGRVWDLWLLQ